MGVPVKAITTWFINARKPGRRPQEYRQPQPRKAGKFYSAARDELYVQSTANANTAQPDLLQWK